MANSKTRPLSLSAAILVAAAGLALSLAGCKSGEQASTGVDPALTATAPAEADPTTGMPAWARGQVTDLNRAIDNAPAAPVDDPPLALTKPPATFPQPTAGDPVQNLLAVDPGPSGPIPQGAEQAAATSIAAPAVLAPEAKPEAATAPPPPKTLEERIQDTALSLMDLLSQQTSTPQTAWKAYLTLAALDLVRPGSMPKLISPDQKGAAVLTAEEISTADTVRQMLNELAAIPGDAPPQARSAKVAELTERITSAAPMRISARELCGRVTGFGQYIPLGTDKFMQGRPQRAIVYVELANFGHKAVSDPRDSGGDKWMVNLSQTLELYHDADGTLAWRRPEEEVMESSRNKRRDFYLVTDITLPPTLTIGAYRLKIIMRDKVSGQTDESVIPFQVVGDPTLALQPGRSLD